MIVFCINGFFSEQTLCSLHLAILFDLHSVIATDASQATFGKYTPPLASTMGLSYSLALPKQSINLIHAGPSHREEDITLSSVAT
jgi:hypothetical protein